MVISALLVFNFSACDNKKTNTISVGVLTERETAILSTTSDKSFVFDFNIDSEYKKASVWIEKYELGELVNDKLSYMVTQVEGNGSIIFVMSKMIKNQKQRMFNIGISSKDSLSSISGYDQISDDLENKSSVWGSFPGENISLDGQVILASICYSNDRTGISSLSNGFYSNADGQMNELKNYDVVYLLKVEFLKGE